MLIKTPMKKGAPTARTTKCISTEQSSTPALDASYPHSEWLSTLPFDTQEFTLFASDQALGDEVAIKLPPLPFVKATKNKSRFEIQNDRGSRMRTSMQRPITQQFLNNKRLDPLIIAERRPIYLGVGPAEKPAESVPAAPASQEHSEATVIESDPQRVSCGSDSPAEAAPAQSAHAESAPAAPASQELSEATVITDDSQRVSDSPAAATPAEDEDAKSDQEAAIEYLHYFVRHHVLFYKGSRLTSAQVLAAIESVAPDDIRTELIERIDITREVKARFGIGMEKRSARIDGRHQKFWADFTILLD